ncbi:Major Facilitator Superfamily protein [Theileria parva strain Muguga]|uniref:Major Facilitator Superfamily protein n=1 Tax=Theileria parva strain Muguga TaxID=333668 RepID=UPI001C61C9B7|nr:Major Facilitator Superfamily protein [Theileria parva strain Muguga]EAN31290.2 Major Facilitator Superfamily protein [Theileria parva strain Muguga]
MKQYEEDSTKKRSLVVEDPKRFPPPFINPFLRLAIYIYIILLTGNFFLGWTGLQELLYKAGSFEELCDESTSEIVKIRSTEIIDCPARKFCINQLYTIQFSTNISMCFLVGIFLDTFGQKYTFVIGQLLSFVCVLLVGIFPKNGPLLRVLFFILGGITEANYLPLTTVSRYYPGNGNFIMSLLGSVRSLSFFMTSILSAVYYKPGVKRGALVYIILVYGLISHVASAIIGIFLVQKDFFGVSDSKPSDSTETLAEIPSKVDSEKDLLKSLREFRIKWVEIVKSGVNHEDFPQTIMFTVSAALYVASVEFISMSQREILRTSSGKSAIGVFRFTSALVFIPGLLVGYISDTFGTPKGLLIMQVSLMLTYVCVMFDTYWGKVLGCVFHLTGGSLFFSIIFFYGYENFPPERLGLGIGIIMFVCGIFVLINIGIYNAALKYTTPDNFAMVAIVLLAYLTVSVASNSGVMYLKSRKSSQKSTTVNLNL